MKRTVAVSLFSAVVLGPQNGLSSLHWITDFRPGYPQVIRLDRQCNVFVASASSGFPVTANAFAANPPTIATRGIPTRTGFDRSPRFYGAFLHGISPKDFTTDDAGYVYVLADHLKWNSHGVWEIGPSGDDPYAAEISVAGFGAREDFIPSGIEIGGLVSQPGVTVAVR